MSAHAESRAGQKAFLDDIEKRISDIFSAQKTEVEQSLIERINREKEEAQKRIEAVNEEFSKVRKVLEEHKTVMAELHEAELHIRGDIRGHFERAVNYQKMMENAATLAGDELEKIGGLNEELEKVRLRAEAEYENIKKHLGGHAGIMATIPAPSGAIENVVDWTEELGKLRKVRDLLATLRQPESSPSDAAGPAAAEPLTGSDAPAPAATEAEELAASLGLIDVEDDGVRDDVEFAEAYSTPAEVPLDRAEGPLVSPALVEEPRREAADIENEIEATMPAAGPGPEIQPVLDALARYRRTESVNNGIEIGFYIAETGAVLDAESFMTAVGKVVDAASHLHFELTHAASVKDLFLLKQEILNQQEILRKSFFRVVRFCEKENGRLPKILGEIVGAQGMKDVIERLTMANWSDPSDFKPFTNELNAMKRAFETRAAASPSYLKSVLDQVEGREN